MSGTINLALSQQFSADGVPLSGGRLYFFAAGTTTPQSAYQDTALTIVHPNPLSLDASGRIPMFYLDDGNIKVRLEDEEGLVIFAADSLLVIGPSGGGGGSSQVDATTVLQTGDMKIRFGTGILTGFVIANGTTIGNTGSGAGQLADPAAEALFKYLHGTPLSMLTSGGAAATKTTPTADWTGNNRMTLPDLRGRTIAGLDDMGSTAAGRLTNAYWGLVGTTPTTVATTLGNAGGSEQRALLTANLAAHTHTGTTGNQSANHTHSGTTLQNNTSLDHHHTYGSSAAGGPSGGGSLITAGNVNNTGTVVPQSGSLLHTHDFNTGNESAVHTHTFTTDSAGTGTAIAIATPSILMSIYIKL